MQLDGEFQAIATAVATKYDSSNLPSVLRVPGGANTLQITGSGTIQGLSPTIGGFIDMTPDTGTFTANYTGFTGSVTANAQWYRIGHVVLLYLAPATGTSNAGTFTLNNLPASISTALGYYVAVPSLGFTDNGSVVSVAAAAQFGGGGISFHRGATTGNWTTSGTKGINGNIVISYVT